MQAQAERSTDPRYHYSNIRRMLDDLIQHVRQDVGAVDDPKAQALFETTAEVLLGLSRAYEHAEQKSERAWQ
jgi:hypothetical protein